LLTSGSSENSYFLRQASRENTEQAVQSEEISSEHPLIKIPGNDAAIYNRIRPKVFKNEQNTETGETLADLLNTDSLISVPFFQQEKLTGRIYLTSKKKSFDGVDAEFLNQLLTRIIPMIDNINLLDKLASEATALQRQKISRDIHDSTVQPYIGIKFGLEALRIKNDSGEDISNEIERLVEMANTNIEEIRGYIDRLKDDKPDALKGSALVSAIRQQAKKIGEFYGIEIEVFAENEISVSDRLSAEIYQIVSEGLSNIKRHTYSNYAVISIQRDDKNLRLEIRNKFSASNGSVEFTPKSITGRAKAIGGQALVETDEQFTKVSVVIPL
jgi:signal transduction histidine kinase